MRLLLFLCVAAFMLYGLDQLFAEGYYTAPLLAMLRDIRHGFGF
jgi:hypothetical protein